MDRKKEGKEGNPFSSDSLEFLRKHLSEHHRFSAKDINSFLERGIALPISVFNERLSILESVVKFLKEEKDLSYRKIGDLLLRDERNIWTTYINSSKKMKAGLDLSSHILVPVSIFGGEAGLYAVVKHLKENLDYSYHKIGVLLSRDERTIWMTYNRKRK